jgi:cell division septal protein FtsQ
MQNVRTIGLTLGTLFLLWLSANLGYWLPVRAIVVSGDFSDMGVYALQEKLESCEGVSLLWSLDEMASSFEEDQWFNKFLIKRSLPDNLAVYVDVRKPVMRWSHNAALLDKHGVLMMTEVPENLLGLPVIHAPESAHGQVFALWMQVSQAEGGWGKQLSAIRQKAMGDWECVFADKITVRLGTKDLKDRLALFLRVGVMWKVLQDAKPQIFDMRYHGSFSHKYTSG